MEWGLVAGERKGLRARLPPLPAGQASSRAPDLSTLACSSCLQNQSSWTSATSRTRKSGSWVLRSYLQEEEQILWNFKKKEMVRNEKNTPPSRVLCWKHSLSYYDPCANGKTSRFLGISIQISGKALGAASILRNTKCWGLLWISEARTQEIQVVKLESWLGDILPCLWNALPGHSTFDITMKPTVQELSQEVPVNQLEVKMKCKPWSKRWKYPKLKIKGIRFDLYLTEESTNERSSEVESAMAWVWYDEGMCDTAIWDETEASKMSWSENELSYLQRIYYQRMFLETNLISCIRT